MYMRVCTYVNGSPKVVNHITGYMYVYFNGMQVIYY